MTWNRSSWDLPRTRLAGGIAIALVVLIGYLPALRGGFVWDDDVYVTRNPLITADDGLRRIWFSRDAPSQYFPLTYTTLRLEHALWGFDPRGYHLLNVVLHCLNALLLWRLLSTLSAPGGWLAAMIFAVHPVNVESVAWISELKNVLSTFFYLLSLLSWLRFMRQEPGKKSWGYPLALLCFLLALFSKTTTATLPVILVLLCWFIGEKINGKRALQILPFFVLGLFMGLVTLWWEEHEQGTTGPEFYLTPLSRLILAGRALWFYLSKLLWPSNLSFSYSRWSIDPGNPWQYAWPAAFLLAVVILWRLRHRIGRGPVTAVLFFSITLMPLLGVFSLYTFRYSFVADHYQYVACMGLIALFAALSASILTSRALTIAAGLTGALAIVVLGLLTRGQAATYKDSETLWRETLRKNPDSWIAHNNLGRVLAERDDIPAAIDHIRHSLRLNPGNLEARINLTVLLASTGDFEGARAQHREALRLGPDSFLARYSFAVVLGSTGLYAEAAAKFREAILIDPSSSRAHAALGVTLAAMGRTAEAAGHYREALRLDPRNERARTNLAEALASPGH